MSKALLFLGICVLAATWATGLAASEGRHCENWLARTPGEAVAFFEETLSRPNLQGREALAAILSLVGTEPLAVTPVEIPRFQNFPVGDEIAPRADHFVLGLAETPAGWQLLLTWREGHQDVAGLAFDEGRNEPSELVVSKNVSAGQYEVDLWTDMSHRLYYSSRHLNLLFNAGGELLEIQAFRFHASGPTAVPRKVVHGSRLILNQ